MTELLFYPLAALAAGAAVAAITRAGAFACALWLAVCLLAAAALAALLAAPTVAAILALIGAGAIVVLVLFVVMLLGPAEDRRPRQMRFEKLLGAAAAGYLAIVMGIAVAIPPFAPAPASGPAYEAPATLGELVLSRYALPFELAGVLLLAATVACVVIAKRGTAAASVEGDEEVALAPRPVRPPTPDTGEGSPA